MNGHVPQLQRRFQDYLISLYQQGFLDDQFFELRKLQDEGCPGFVTEVVSLFFDDCEKLINNMAGAMDQTGNVDFKQVDASVHQLKGSSSSVGARRVKSLCIAFKEYCDAQSLEGCVSCLQQVDHEYKLLKSKLQDLFNLEQQILHAGGTIPQVCRWQSYLLGTAMAMPMAVSVEYHLGVLKIVVQPQEHVLKSVLWFQVGESRLKTRKSR